jgi:pimeloyl-ACP methyl ester carboxylesterase
VKAGAREVWTPDGRRLAVWVDGEGDDFVLFHSGTPEDGALDMHRSRIEAAAERGLTCIGYSRPGYPYSDRHPGRRIVDCADDVLAIVDALAVDSFFTVGWSGGGPYALACAARLGNRIRAAATVGSNAPRRAAGLDWYAGMGAENVAEFGAAEEGSAALEEYLEREAAKWRTAEPEDVFVHFGDLLPDDARQTMSVEELEIALASMRNAVRTGIWGWFDDDTATVADWGFDPACIEVPVAVWHGGEEDKFIPCAHGEWLVEAIPDAVPCFRPAADHMTMASSFEEIFDSLRARG